MHSMIYSLRRGRGYAILRHGGEAARPLLAATPPTVNTNHRDRLVKEERVKSMTKQTADALEFLKSLRETPSYE